MLDCTGDWLAHGMLVSPKIPERELRIWNDYLHPVSSFDWYLVLGDRPVCVGHGNFNMIFHKSLHTIAAKRRRVSMRCFLKSLVSHANRLIFGDDAKSINSDPKYKIANLDHIHA